MFVNGVENYFAADENLHGEGDVGIRPSWGGCGGDAGQHPDCDGIPWTTERMQTVRSVTLTRSWHVTCVGEIGHADPVMPCDMRWWDQSHWPGHVIWHARVRSVTLTLPCHMTCEGEISHVDPAMSHDMRGWDQSRWPRHVTWHAFMSRLRALTLITNNDQCSMIFKWTFKLSGFVWSKIVFVFVFLVHPPPIPHLYLVIAYPPGFLQSQFSLFRREIFNPEWFRLGLLHVILLFRYGSLLNEARKISVKSGLASAIGQGVPWFLTFSISGATIYLTGSMVNQGKSEPGFVLVVSLYHSNQNFENLQSIVNSDEL